MMAIQWRTKPFHAFTVHEFHDLLRLRIDIFVVEQTCVYPELDGLDPTALHLMGYALDGTLVACARILLPEPGDVPHIGRVAVRMDQRGHGIASALMEHALEDLQKHYGSRRSALAAQAHLELFYARFGFKRQGPDYLLDGIPHVDMHRDAD